MSPRIPQGEEHFSRAIFYAFVALITLTCIAALWAILFLPMQDYPQHLFISHVLATWDDARYNWRDIYSAHLTLAPYSLEYFLMVAFSAVMDSESAGKAYFTLYFLLLAAMIWRAERLFFADRTPWALLIVFPAALGHIYFLGFQNYLLSIPILFLALFDLHTFTRLDSLSLRERDRARGSSAEDIRITPSPRPSPGGRGGKDIFMLRLNLLVTLRQGAYVIVLFLCHPYTVLVYLVYAGIGAVIHRHDVACRARYAWTIVVTTLVFGTWAALSTVAQPDLAPEWRLAWWWPVELTAAFLVSTFTGLKIFGGIDPVATLLWVALLALFAVAAYTARAQFKYHVEHRAWFASAALGYAVLPSWVGYYSYFNARLVPVMLIALALMLARVPLRTGWGITGGVLCAALVGAAIQLHASVSAETAELLPLFEQMESNARIVPVYFDPGSRHLDPELFSDFHSHDHNYYHVRVGGGGNPYLFVSPLLPLQFRGEVQLTVPNRQRVKEIEDWSELSHGYRYVLVRGEPTAALLRHLGATAELKVRSGVWALYEVK